MWRSVHQIIGASSSIQWFNFYVIRFPREAGHAFKVESIFPLCCIIQIYLHVSGNQKGASIDQWKGTSTGHTLVSTSHFKTSWFCSFTDFLNFHRLSKQCPVLHRLAQGMKTLQWPMRAWGVVWGRGVCRGWGVEGGKLLLHYNRGIALFKLCKFQTVGIGGSMAHQFHCMWFGCDNLNFQECI